MTVSVSETATVQSRFSKIKTETGCNASVSPKMPSRKAFSRSPYLERTIMLRVPESLATEFRKRLDQHKQAVGAGIHDNWE